MPGCTKIFVVLSIYINLTLALVDRILQLVYYGTTKFNSLPMQSSLLCIIIVKPVSLMLFKLIYLISIQDEYVSFYEKMKNFFVFSFSQEFSYTLGVHYTFKSRLSRDGDSTILTARVLNIFHIMLVSIPQILTASTSCVIRGYIEPLDIASIVFSSVFITWSIVYMMMCFILNDEYEEKVSEMLNE